MVMQGQASFLFQEPLAILWVISWAFLPLLAFLNYSLASISLSFADGSPDALQNPCYIGTHGCDTNAACRPGPGVQFTCECSIGFRGDGRTCSGMAIHSDLWGLGNRPGEGIQSSQTRGPGEAREQGWMCPAPHLGSPCNVRGSVPFFHLIQCRDSQQQRRIHKAMLYFTLRTHRSIIFF